MSSHKPVIIDRKKEKKIMFEKGRALGSELEIELQSTHQSAQTKRTMATGSTFTTPKKVTPKLVNTIKRNTTGAKAQRMLLDNIHESQNEAIVGKYTPFDNDSTDDEWERELATTYKSQKRWLDNWTVHEPSDFTEVAESKVQSKMSTISNGFYKPEKASVKRAGSSVPPNKRAENRSVGPATDRVKPKDNLMLSRHDQGEVSQFEEDLLKQVGFRSTALDGCSDSGKSRCLGMVSNPLSLMSTPVDQKFMKSTSSFNPDRTGASGFSSTKMYDGASNDRSDGFKSTFLGF